MKQAIKIPAINTAFTAGILPIPLMKHNGGQKKSGFHSLPGVVKKIEAILIASIVRIITKTFI